MSTQKPPLPLISRRLRRWQDVAEFTNERAAEFFGIPLRTYTDCLYGEHFPRGIGAVALDRELNREEKRLKLPPLIE